MLRDSAIALGAFAAGAALAGLLGAANLGTALGIAVIPFCLALFWLMLGRRGGHTTGSAGEQP